MSPFLVAALTMPLPAHASDGIAFIEAQFTATSGASPVVSPANVYDPGFEWDELVVSWNVEGRADATIEVKARVLYDDGPTSWYTFGPWALAPSLPRFSVKDQKNDWGRMDTDTLILKKPARKVELDIVSGSRKPKFIGLSFRNSRASPRVDEANRNVWGKVIEVPRRSQMTYPGGNVLCSPTCVSMLLWHWSKELGRPDLNRDVPEVQAGVHDPNWPGTGNWPFNTAFAGSFSGIRGYVARLGSVRELEDWIEAGIPVATSVSSALLKGRPKKEPNDGHLVVVVGFTKDGDPVFNDPGRSVEVRQIYKRSHLEAAWRSSGNTVYLIYPESKRPPENRFGHWAG